MPARGVLSFSNPGTCSSATSRGDLPSLISYPWSGRAVSGRVSRPQREDLSFLVALRLHAAAFDRAASAPIEIRSADRDDVLGPLRR